MLRREAALSALGPEDSADSREFAQAVHRCTKLWTVNDLMRAWVKVYTSITSDRNFRRLSSRARLTFLVSIPEAGRCDRGGLLAERTGPITTGDFCEMTGLLAADQKLALKELVRSGFFKTMPEGYFVEHFAERYNPQLDPSNAERQRRHRAKSNGVTPSNSNGTVTPLRNGLDIDIELEEEGESNGARPDVDFGDLEADVDLYVANAGADNKSGTVTPNRRLSLRRELHAEMGAHDRTFFGAGLREANAAGAANVRYVRKCAKSAAGKSSGGVTHITRRPPSTDLSQKPEYSR
jgi:hypothetical protein